jgi:Domain of unknown function (DUF4272)
VLRRRKRERVSPDQEAVVDRVLCVAVPVMLGAVATGVAEGAMDAAQAERYVTESHRWLRRENLADALSARERKLIAQQLADWTERDTIDASWRNEAVGALLWALSVIPDMPPYDDRFGDIPSYLPLLAPTAEFRMTAALRPAEEIARARDLAELWHWRARTTQLQRSGDPQGAAFDLEAIVRQSAALSYSEGGIPEPIDGDFPFLGKAFRDLDADEYSLATSIARERQFALNWLCGHSADWDKTPTDT